MTGPSTLPRRASENADRPRWAQTPEPLVGLGDQTGPGREYLAIAVAAIGPVARALSLTPPDAWLAAETLFAVVIASVTLGRIQERRWLLRLPIALVAGAVLFPSQGKLVAGWVTGGILLADWAIRRRRTLPFLPRPLPTAAAPVAVLSLVGAYRGSGTDTSPLILLPLVLAIVVTLISAWGGPLHRGLDRAGAFLARVVAAVTGRVVFTMLGLAIVAVPWAVQRLLRVDPLAWTTDEGSSWTTRIRRDVQPSDPWTRESTRRQIGAPQRIRGAVPVLLLVAAAIVVGVWRLDRAPSGVSDVSQRAIGVDGSTPSDVPAAQSDQEWYPDYVEDMNWVSDDRVAWNLFDQYRFADVTTRYINIVDGRRVSWAPPASSRPRRTVWIYGGSTTFGVGQRDDHTIASELSRVAHDAGIDLDVVNRGVNGQMHWLEANRLAWDLATDPPPDLVVFYDGVNEIWGALQLDDLGVGDRRNPLDPMTTDFEHQLEENADDAPPAPPGAKLSHQAKRKLDEPVALGTLAVRRYERSRLMSLATARGYGVPVRYFWQPSRYARPQVEGEPRTASYSDAFSRTMYATAASLIEPDVTDLSDVFDDVDRPLYTDDVHHNEYGATIVARAMFESLRPDLEQPR